MTGAERVERKKNTVQGTLSYRLATDEDLVILQGLRKECGWGLEKLNAAWGKGTHSYCVFHLERPNGDKEDVGMGGWLLDDAQDPESASRELGNVCLVSLFIRHAYQDAGLGSLALAMLEAGAVDIHHARWINLDTAAYYCEPTPEGYFIERPDIPNRAIQWYESKGYRVYRPNQPMFPNPAPDSPDQKILGTSMRKRPLHWKDD